MELLALVLFLGMALGVVGILAWLPICAWWSTR